MNHPGVAVVIGASAGGVEALTRVCRSLPTPLPAVVLIVLHLSADAADILPAILQRHTPSP